MVCVRRPHPKHRREMDSLKETKPRIVVTDDHPATIKLVNRLLEGQFEIVGSSQNGLEAIGSVARFQPDVLLTDIEMPMMDGIRAARHLQQMNSALKIVFMSASADPDIVNAALSTGALAFVLKSRLATDLEAAIREALAGRQFVSETVEVALPAYLATFTVADVVRK